LILIGFLGLSMAQAPSLTIEQVMTANELQDTGVAYLTSEHRNNLNRWLLAYTLRIMKASSKSTPTPTGIGGTGCSPAIESTLAGEFNGWEGETIFKLDNGQIWQQTEFAFVYSYAYRPEATIYSTARGCKLKVAGEDDTILVRRIK
jgi:hypothetical protein